MSVHFAIEIKYASSTNGGHTMYIEAPENALVGKVHRDLKRRFGPLVKMQEFITPAEYLRLPESIKFQLLAEDVC